MRVVVGTIDVVKDRVVVVVVDELGFWEVVVVVELDGGRVVVLLAGGALVVVVPGFGPSWKMTMLTGRKDALSSVQKHMF